MNRLEFFIHVQEVKDYRGVSQSLNNQEFIKAFVRENNDRGSAGDVFETFDDTKKEGILEGLIQFMPLSWELLSSFFKRVKENSKIKEAVTKSVWALTDTMAMTLGEKYFEVEMTELDRRLYTLGQNISELDETKLTKMMELSQKETQKVTLEKDISQASLQAYTLCGDIKKLEKFIEETKVKNDSLTAQKEALQKKEEAWQKVHKKIIQEEDFLKEIEITATNITNDIILDRLEKVKKELRNLNNEIRSHCGIRDRAQIDIETLNRRTK